MLTTIRPPTEEADIISESLPFPVQFALSSDFTNRVRNVEKDTLEGLEKAGFKLDFGVDGGGIARQYMTRGGGYYIDVGCSPLIIDGKIKVKQSPEGISGLNERGLVLKDGSPLEADIVVLATGYDNMRTTVRKVLGDPIADRLVDVWDLDEEGELNGVCLPPLPIFHTFFTQYANENYRCGVPAATQASGIWAGTLPSAESTPSSWHYRSRLSSRGLQQISPPVLSCKM